MEDRHTAKSCDADDEREPGLGVVQCAGGEASYCTGYVLPLSNRSASLRGGNEQTRHTFKAACSNALLAHKSLCWLQPTVRSLMRVFKLKRRATSRSSVTPWSSRSRSKVEQRHWQIVGLTSFSLRVWSSLAGSAIGSEQAMWKPRIPVRVLEDPGSKAADHRYLQQCCRWLLATPRQPPAHPKITDLNEQFNNSPATIAIERRILPRQRPIARACAIRNPPRRRRRPAHQNKPKRPLKVPQ